VDYEALLALPDVDAVVICSPNALHASQVGAALTAGKDAFVQKPLATSLVDCRGVVELASRMDKLLFVDYSYRFLDTIRVLCAEATRIGPVRRVSGAFHNIYGPGKAWFFRPDLSGGGALVDLGVHLLDLALEILRPHSLSLSEAHLAYGRGHLVEDAAHLKLELDAVPFDVDVSWQANRVATQIYLELEGELGRVRWENVNGSFFRFRTLREGVVLLDQETTLRTDTLRAFVRDYRHNERPPIDLRCYAVLDQAYGRATD